jgi:hypothetical protein
MWVGLAIPDFFGGGYSFRYKKYFEGCTAKFYDKQQKNLEE